MAALSIHDDLARQLEELAHQNQMTVDDLVEELLALYHSINPYTSSLSANLAPDSQAYIGSLGSMCSVGEGNLSSLSMSFRESILDSIQSTTDDKSEK